MAAMPGRWFGFGFNQFGQVVNRRECEGDGKVLEPVTVTVHSLGKAGQWPAGGSCLRKLSPAWSHTACLGDDGSIYVFGFVDGRPWQQMCIVNQAHRGCMDILSSEKYLLMLWQDRVECRDIQNLSTGEVEGDLIWVKQLKDREKQCTALPLIPDGYVTTTLPFYKPLAPQLRARKLALGSEHAVLLSSDFTVYSWGSGRHGQLGHGGVEDEAEPRIVEALHGLAMAEIAAGGWHSVSSSASGDLYVWGWNESGQLGLPAKSCSEEKHRKTPQQKRLSGEAFPALLDLPEELEVSKVSCGSRHSAVITREGKLFTWGWGNYGQLGHGQSNSSDLPRLVEYFVRNRLSVLDVVCGTWNTFVFAQQEAF
ncbi:RCC1 domain-containing protein 1 isoform X2 [Rhincodon typus]|uniref:RCC1 domain-containing protein 1 isoform X2 n=1 Tax=Rhincodon typus TaxID=259920 RepID=UPI00202FFFCD|nr:RCC1 domain-containing protein 1 isoform X2 [Rhincodon typus]